MEHWNLPKAFDVEDVIDPSPKEITCADVIDLKQSRQTDFTVQEVTIPTWGKEKQSYPDSSIRLIEAKTRQNIAYIVLGALILLIGCGFAAFLLRGDSTFLSVILGLVEGLVGGVIGYFFAKREKRE